MKRIQLQPNLSVEEIEQRYRSAGDGVSRSHWQIIWLLSRGERSEAIETSTGYSLTWIRTIARRYNAGGPDEIGDKRAGRSGRRAKLSIAQQEQLKTLLHEAHARHENWTGPQVAAWMSEQLGYAVHVQRGYEWLAKLGFSSQVPRRQHIEANANDQAIFKKRSQLH